MSSHAHRVPKPAAKAAEPMRKRASQPVAAMPSPRVTQRLAADAASAAPGGAVAAYAAANAASQARAVPNWTGLPDGLKRGMEALSGVAMDDVRVHRNSSAPAQLEALAHTQGSDIHLAAGQERHLPHEAWHVVQQKQGRVKPTMRLGGTSINDDDGLEAEADAMGARAGQMGSRPMLGGARPADLVAPAGNVAQRVEVDEKRGQKLVQDVQGGKLANTAFEWQSKFNVEIQNDEVVVTIRVKAAIDAQQFEDVWARQVERQWSNRFMLKFEGKNYPIVVRLVQVGKGEHYPIKVSGAESALGSGARGHFGTENMTTWGMHDTTNIAHEVGHMLGNIDEYGVVEAFGRTRDYLTTPSETIMGVPQNNPIANHYYLIKWAAEKELNKGRQAPAATGEVLPYVARSGGKASSGGVSMQEMMGVKLKSTPKPISPMQSQVQLPDAPRSSPKLAPKAAKEKDVQPSAVQPPSSSRPSLRSVPKIAKEPVVEQPNELEQLLARRRLRQQAASSTPPVVEQQPVVEKTPVVVEQVPEEAPQEQPRVSEADIQEGREIINRAYRMAMQYAAAHGEEMGVKVKTRFRKIAAHYDEASPEAENYAEILQSCVKAARETVKQFKEREADNK